MKNEAKRIEAALPLLIDWYRTNRKTLPWRLSPTPYHVWISEIMLQQTRIEAVIPYYHRFLEELPTVQDLAAVDDDRLMKLWQGLGYYSRARNLKKAAQMICDLYNGILPKSAAELKKLPGIGDYTAGAISSIAYGEPEPAVDGNVLRVLTRLCACGDDIAQPVVKSTAADVLRQSYPRGEEASLLTEGLMELGEVVCIPNGEAKCSRCPLQVLCLAYQRDEMDRYPVKSQKKPRRIENRTVFLLTCGGKYAICRRPDKGLLAGLWEFPNAEGHFFLEEAGNYLRKQGITPTSLEACGDAKHIFSHVEWHMIGYRVECAAESTMFLWKTADEIRGEYAIPTALRAYERLL